MDTRHISPLVLRQRLAELIEEVGDTGNTLVIESGKKPAAVLVGYEQYRSLLHAAGRPDIVSPPTQPSNG